MVRIKRDIGERYTSKADAEWYRDRFKHGRRRTTHDREVAALEIGNYRKLERAFGKDGVPALLIEQALPQIEEKANELLESGQTSGNIVLLSPELL